MFFSQNMVTRIWKYILEISSIVFWSAIVFIKNFYLVQRLICDIKSIILIKIQSHWNQKLVFTVVRAFSELSVPFLLQVTYLYSDTLS